MKRAEPQPAARMKAEQRQGLPRRRRAAVPLPSRGPRHQLLPARHWKRKVDDGNRLKAAKSHFAEPAELSYLFLIVCFWGKMDSL